MDNLNRYSPAPIEDYVITSLPHCEARAISEQDEEHALPLWNLFWLSVPALDALLTHGRKRDWNIYYSPVPNAMKHIVADVYGDFGDEVLRRSLVMPPSRFLDWFISENHSMYETYTALGGPKWVRNVLDRAEQAAIRMAAEAKRHMAKVVSLRRSGA